MEARTRDLIEVCLREGDYRTFLGRIFETLGRHSRGGRFNHSTFARKAGLKSRGFAQEVVSGRKRLTKQSHPKFEKGLDLPDEVRFFLKLLLIRDEPEFNSEELSQKEIGRRIRAAQERFRAELSTSESKKTVSKQLYKHRHVLTVYATLGNQETGASFDDVVRRTGLQPAICRRVLDHLIAENVAVENNGRYRSINSHMVFKGLPGDHPMRDAYLETLSDLQKVAREKFSDVDKSFIQSHVSINPKRLPALKRKLFNAIIEFVEECDDDDGEQVAKLLVGFYV